METVELLKGVEILSVSEQLPLFVSVFLMSLCFVVVLLSTYLLADSITNGFGGGIILSLVFVGIGIGLAVTTINETINPTLTYKVLVDDSVSMNEFNEKYEVISVDGKIYTIKEKGE